MNISQRTDLNGWGSLKIQSRAQDTWVHLEIQGQREEWSEKEVRKAIKNTQKWAQKKWASLESHIEKKASNRSWLASCIIKGKPKYFPYRPEENLSIRGASKQRNPAPLEKLQASEKTHPVFLVNIPVASPHTKKVSVQARFILTTIANEAFGRNMSESRRSLNKLAIVLGFNRIRSIDERRNRAFREEFNSFSIKGIRASLLRFFLTPYWSKQEKWEEEKLYPAKKAFFILRHFNTEVSQKILNRYEASSRFTIPFSRIREMIKNCSATRSFLDNFTESYPRSPVYYTLMDDDFRSLKAPQPTGIFSRVTKLIKEKNHPSKVSLGYSFAENVPILTRLALKLDMKMREKMEGLCYLPEPFSVFRVSKRFFSKLSFIQGNQEDLESRHFRKNGEKFFPGEAVFHADGGVVTTTPKRMISEKAKKIESLSLATLKRKPVIQGLRSSRMQSHVFPRVWADNLYASLGFKVSVVAKVKGPMTHIFGVFDPLSRMLNTVGRYSSSNFDDVLENYFDPLSDAQENMLNTQKAKLAQQGVPKAIIDQIERIARNCGIVIYRELVELKTFLTERETLTQDSPYLSRF